MRGIDRVLFNYIIDNLVVDDIEGIIEKTDMKSKVLTNGQTVPDIHKK